MRGSEHRILTSHVGSLPRPDALIAANRARAAGEPVDGAGFQQQLREAVAQVVRRQRDLGIDVPNDGEFGKSVTDRVHYGAWWNYAFARWGGLQFGAPGPYGRTPRRSRSGEIVLTSRDDRRDRQRFAAASECQFPNSVDNIFAWSSLDDGRRRKLLWDNAARFYRQS
jgi:5-methyltetrahydropteroyltriglutamate--homocysteine methyltransferase